MCRSRPHQDSLLSGISNSTFVGNSVSGSGTGVYVESSTGTRPALTVRGGAFQANTADVNGGAFHITSTTTSLRFADFSQNVASNGAGLYASATTLSMSHTSMKLNTATESGGALYMDDGASVLLCNQSSLRSQRCFGRRRVRSPAGRGVREWHALRAERGYGRPGQGRCRNAPRRG